MCDKIIVMHRKEKLMKEISRVFLLYGALGLDKGDSYDFLRILAKAPKENIWQLLAVRDTIGTLVATGENEAAEAIKYIYFSKRKVSTAPLDISMSVKRFASERYLDERTVYRRLKKTENIYFAHLKSHEKCA